MISEEIMKKLFLFICFLLYAQSLWAAEPLNIGLIAPITGDFANVGRETKDVLDLLAADVNEHGGVLDRKVKLLFEDDGGTVSIAQAAAKKLVQQKIIAVVGSYASTITESLQNIFNEAKIIQISYGSTAIPLTAKGLKYFFRTCPRDNEQAKAAGKVIQKMKMKKVAILHDNSLYGKGLAETVQNWLHYRSIKVVFYEALIPGQQDYVPLLEKAKATEPELVFFAGYYPEAAKLLLGRQQLNWKVPFMGGDAVNHQLLVNVTGKKAAEGFYFLSPPNPADLGLPKTNEFLARFEKKYGYRPSSIHALLAGDAFSAIVQSMRKVDTDDPDIISAYLRENYYNPAGLTGTIYFDFKGDVMNDLHAIYRVDGRGRFIIQRLLKYGEIVK
jgi:branched-chain amino acid transport system substrate-binding protein